MHKLHAARYIRIHKTNRIIFKYVKSACIALKYKMSKPWNFSPILAHFYFFGSAVIGYLPFLARRSIKGVLPVRSFYRTLSSKPDY